jgi:hypothetical protein
MHLWVLNQVQINKYPYKYTRKRTYKYTYSTTQSCAYASLGWYMYTLYTVSDGH